LATTLRRRRRSRFPIFYGAHGYDPKLREMSAIFYAAGPQVCRDGIEEVRNIDLAPTVLALLGVQPADTVQGRACVYATARPRRRRQGSRRSRL